MMLQRFRGIRNSRDHIDDVRKPGHLHEVNSKAKILVYDLNGWMNLPRFNLTITSIPASLATDVKYEHPDPSVDVDGSGFVLSDLIDPQIDDSGDARQVVMTGARPQCLVPWDSTFGVFVFVPQTDEVVVTEAVGTCRSDTFR
jgi:hypothetical protein